jgi:hypothetical protein
VDVDVRAVKRMSDEWGSHRCTIAKCVDGHDGPANVQSTLLLSIFASSFRVSGLALSGLDLGVGNRIMTNLLVQVENEISRADWQQHYYSSPTNNDASKIKSSRWALQLGRDGGRDNR